MLYATSMYFYLPNLTNVNLTVIVLLHVGVAFNIEDFSFLYFWSAATNALMGVTALP